MKKKHSFWNVRCALLLVGALTTMTGVAQTLPTTPGPKPTLKPPPPKMACRVDPSVTDLLFAIVNRTSSTTGVVSITGVVTNRGNRDYVSEIQQQSIQIFENGNREAHQAVSVPQSEWAGVRRFPAQLGYLRESQGGKPPTTGSASPIATTS